MPEHIEDVQPVTMSSQAFLLLCRLFDGCYDELKETDSLHELIESIANILLAGVDTLEKQEKKPRTITFPLTLQQSFFLRRLIVEMLARAPQKEDRMMEWLQECLTALSGGGGGDAAQA